MADGKLLKILSKIAGKLTYLKDVITITEPCAPTRRRPARQRQPPHWLPASLPRLPFFCVRLQPVGLPPASRALTTNPNPNPNPKPKPKPNPNPNPNQARLELVPHAALLLHNDCLLLAHACLTLGAEYPQAG